ncbi:MAG: LuxR family transcriptional regulator [Alphaproteobacteria bacterium]|nr:MAG: LuxR family transcriptional regulator [Alphaproteobacteria bacterium]
MDRARTEMSQRVLVADDHPLSREGLLMAVSQVFPSSVNAVDSGLVRDQIASLSQAQRKVLFSLADGQANKKIAHDLAVTEAMIKAHLTVIFRKLGVTNRMQAMLVMQPLLRDLAA